MPSLLSQRALLIRPSISVWRGEITDKAASRETAKAASADERSVRTSKFLVPRDAVEPVMAAANELRSYVRRETLPWAWDGVSLCPAEAYMPFMSGWRSRRWDFDGAKGELGRRWDFHVIRGKAALGRLANDYDYPSWGQVEPLFNVSLECFPVPDADDFRANVSEAEAEEIRASIQANSQQELDRVQTYLWEQMSDCVGHIVERLSAYGKDATTGRIVGKFHDTLIGNLRDLVDRLSRLNLTRDPQIEAMRQRLAASLCAHEPDELRADASLRESVRDEAARIAADMAAIYGPRATS